MRSGGLHHGVGNWPGKYISGMKKDRINGVSIKDTPLPRSYVNYLYCTVISCKARSLFRSLFFRTTPSYSQAYTELCSPQVNPYRNEQLLLHEYRSLIYMSSFDFTSSFYENLQRTIHPYDKACKCLEKGVRVVEYLQFLIIKTDKVPLHYPVFTAERAYFHNL